MIDMFLKRVYERRLPLTICNTIPTKIHWIIDNITFEILKT